MIAVYCLPTNRMYDNIRSSVEFMKLGELPRWSKNVVHTSLDNFADVIILTKAVYPVENVIESAMLNPSWSANAIPAKTFSEGFIKLIESDYRGIDEKPFIYPRYWHGYLVILKPMLLIFKAEQLRVLNLYIQFLLTVTALVLLYKRLGIYYTYSFAIIILAINPITTVLAFQHTNVYCIMLFTVIFILLFNERLKQNHRYIYFFMIIGIITAYFDLLTYPLVPLGVGLSLYIALNKENFVEASKKSIIFQLFNKCFSWAFGYIGMWGGKVILATILTSQNVILDALNELYVRTSHHEGHGFDGEPITIIRTFERNINDFCEGPIKVILILAFIYILYLVFVKYKNKFILNKSIFTAFAFVFLLPFLWYTAACNHSFMHSHFTYRELSIAAFSLFAFIIESIPELKRIEN